MFYNPSLAVGVAHMLAGVHVWNIYVFHKPGLEY
jgi:hypothetical protein